MSTKTAVSLAFLAGLVLLSAVPSAHAFELGIRLDAFLGKLEATVTGTGLLIGAIGGAGMIAAKMENAYGQLFSGFLNFFISAGILGGLTTILGAIGLVSGASLIGW